MVQSDIDGRFAVPVRGRRVVVAMSGGVDSSVAAILLREAGADVVGATLRMRECAGDGVSCCAGDGENSAATVCASLGIPHFIVDCRAEFEREVLARSWDEYARGRTPSPCIVCNEHIKFGFLRKWGLSQGIDLLATGHYVSTSEGAPRVFVRPSDRRKDQTYFLCRVRPDDGLIFPLQHLEKTQVRAIAAANGLVVATRPDSQDACYASEGNTFAESLRSTFGGVARPGRFLDETGRGVGSHPGIHLFTVGQGRGFCVGDGRKWWVAAIDPESADITLTRDPEVLNSLTMTLTGVMPAREVDGSSGGPSWLDSPLLSVVVRHGGTPVPVQCRDAGDGRLLAAFAQPVRAVTPGQAAVFYDGDELVAGAWIEGR